MSSAGLGFCCCFVNIALILFPPRNLQWKLTDEFVTRDHLTALMITHHMEDALKYGNRLIVMKDGQIIKDLTKEEKDQLDITDYYAMFE